LEDFVKKIQLDIVDGRFAPNMTVMPKHFIRFNTKLKLQIHLMCFKPEQYVLSFAQIGAKEFIFHVENMERKFDRQILRGKTIVNQTLRMTISNF
jgi:pentose-5-phosphate-3-epimerase